MNVAPPPPPPTPTVLTPYDDAVSLLRALSGSFGIRASLSSNANYGAVFARDAVMAGLAGLLIEDGQIARSLVTTLEQLRDLQGPEGQIASNYALRDGEPPRVSFGSLVPRIDAPLWYLVGVGLAARAGALDPAAFHTSIALVVRMLDALEYNGRHLIYIPAGGDWADEYVYDGYILHDQVLRAWGLRLAGQTYGRQDWCDKAAAIEQAIAASYWPADADRGFPLAAFSPTRVYDIFDLATCSLLAVSGATPVIASAALDWIGRRFLDRDQLPPAFFPVIEEGDPDWSALQRYHLHGFRNRPHEYHNGGIWMIWLGWLALGLAAGGRQGELDRLCNAVAARLRAIGRYGFDEYLHGLSGMPLGTPQMAYSATGIVFLSLARTPERLGLLRR